MLALAARAGEGAAMLVLLGGPYLVMAGLGRLWPGGGRAGCNALHRLGGPWFAGFCRRHGALMLKVGQVVGSRPDLLPLAWVDACADLRDQAPARPWRTVRGTLARAYEGRTAEHLLEIEQRPIASASFGQVHRAKLPDGTTVAVKVQHAGLGPLVATDLLLLRAALSMLRLAVPDWPVELMLEEIQRTSREEQDYLHEAIAAGRLRPLLQRNGLTAPQVYLEHTRETVLVTAFAPGTTLAQLDLASLPRERRRELAERIAGAWIAMLLDEGFFHADPHGGNLILDGEQVWVIDFGMTASLTPLDRLRYAQFLRRLGERDVDGMVAALVQLGVLLPGADLDAIRSLAQELFDGLGQLNPRAFKGSQRERELSAKVSAFLRRARGLAFPRHTILLTRALGLLEGVCGELDPERNLIDIVRPRLRLLTTARGRLEDLLAEGRQRLTRWLELPERLERIERQLGRPAQVDLSPVIAGLALVAALLLPPGTWRLVAAIAAGLGLVLTLRR